MTTTATANKTSATPAAGARHRLISEQSAPNADTGVGGTSTWTQHNHAENDSVVIASMGGDQTVTMGRAKRKKN